MPVLDPQHLQPIAALRQAALGRAIIYLSSHPIPRLAVGVAGVGLLLLGVVAAPFREVPLLSWLSVAPIAAASMAGGLGALGIWHLSRPTPLPASSAEVQTVSDSSASADWVQQLERLRDLHATGALTDNEFTRAKARLLQ